MSQTWWVYVIAVRSTLVRPKKYMKDSPFSRFVVDRYGRFHPIFPDCFTSTRYKWSNLRTKSRFAPSQWETVLFCNDVSHWLGANLESALNPENMAEYTRLINNS